jgi:hypothetical protein
MNPDTYDFLITMSVFSLSLCAIGLVTVAFIRISREYQADKVARMAEYNETVNRR